MGISLSYLCAPNFSPCKLRAPKLNHLHKVHSKGDRTRHQILQNLFCDYYQLIWGKNLVCGHMSYHGLPKSFKSIKQHLGTTNVMSGSIYDYPDKSFPHPRYCTCLILRQGTLAESGAHRFSSVEWPVCPFPAWNNRSTNLGQTFYISAGDLIQDLIVVNQVIYWSHFSNSVIFFLNETRINNHSR